MTEEELESTTVEIVPPTQLQVMVEKADLEPSKAKFIIQQFTEHFSMAAEWAKKAKSIVVTDETQTDLMKRARTGRLFLREKRLEIEKARKRLKEEALREGQAIDKIANFLKDLISPTEDHLDRQEKFVEYRDKAIADAKAAEEARMAEAAAMKEAKEAELERVRILAENAKLKAEADIKEKELKETQDKLVKVTQSTMKSEAASLLKALAKSDEEKLLILKNNILAILVPEVKNPEYIRIVKEVQGHLYIAASKIKLIVNEEEF